MDFFETFKKQREQIARLGEIVADDLAAYVEDRHRRPEFLAHLKELRHVLRETEQTVIRHEEETCRRPPDTSESQDCFLCNGHYAFAGEHALGLRYEPIPGKGSIFLCWECVFALATIIDRQRNGLAYTFLFSRTRETRELVKQTVQPIEDGEKAP